MPLSAFNQATSTEILPDNRLPQFQQKKKELTWIVQPADPKTKMKTKRNEVILERNTLELFSFSLNILQSPRRE